MRLAARGRFTCDYGGKKANGLRARTVEILLPMLPKSGLSRASSLRALKRTRRVPIQRYKKTR